MNNKKLLNLYGLKWNPFETNLPVEGLIISSKIDSFCFRVENLVMDGGYAMITGHPGTGKSVVLRILANRLEQIPEIKVGVLTRPQSNMADFYRELGDLFGVELRASNKYGGYKALRKKWSDHINSTLFRPVLLVDEAQEMISPAMTELRLLMSANFDSECILTVIFCGDTRLPDKFREPDLIPLGSRIRVRLNQENASKDDLVLLLKEGIKHAGNSTLLSKELISILAEHATGNYRSMMIMASNLLAEGMAKEVNQLDEKLFFDIYGPAKRGKRKQK